MIANNLVPKRPVHPGEMINDEIEYRGISRHALASEIGMDEAALSAVLEGKAPVSAECALLLEAALDINADIWLSAQAAYNRHTALADRSLAEKIRRIRSAAAFL